MKYLLHSLLLFTLTFSPPLATLADEKEAAPGVEKSKQSIADEECE